jgi:hypothetical protein
MDHLQVHSRVLAHLSRFSLDAPRRFFVLLIGDKSDAHSKTIRQVSSAFGCCGFICIDDALDEEKSDDTETPTFRARSLGDALALSRSSWQSEVIAVVVANEAIPLPTHSLSLSHPKAFPRTATFVFIQSTNDIDLTVFDRVIHLTQRMVKHAQLNESAATAVTVLHQFLQSRGEKFTYDGVVPVFKDGIAAAAT